MQKGGYGSHLYGFYDAKKKWTKALKSIKEFDKKVMIVIVSAEDDEDVKRDMIINGAEDYITKPINVFVF